MELIILNTSFLYIFYSFGSLPLFPMFSFPSIQTFSYFFSFLALHASWNFPSLPLSFPSPFSLMFPLVFCPRPHRTPLRGEPLRFTRFHFTCLNGGWFFQVCTFANWHHAEVTSQLLHTDHVSALGSVPTRSAALYITHTHTQLHTAGAIK